MGYRIKFVRSRRLPWLALWLLPLLALLGPACTSWKLWREASVLTSIEQVRQLTLEEANRGYPVRLQAVVTYYDLPLDLMIQDTTAGIAIDISKSPVTVAAEQMVEVEGFTGVSGSIPVIIRPVVKGLGPGRMPPPRLVSFPELASGQHDYSWIETQGIVRSAAVDDDGRLVLDVVSEGRRAKVYAPQNEGIDFSTLIDAKIRFRGVASTVVNVRGLSVRSQIYVPRLAEMTVTEPVPADPFSIPVRSIESLAHLTPEAMSGHRLRVQGVVVGQPFGEHITITDPTSQLRIQAAQMRPLQPGDRVDVSGFPVLGASPPELEQAVLRPLSPQKEIPNSKHQIPKGNSKFQAPSTKHLEFGIWDLGFPPERVLTTVQQVHRLTPDEAKRGYPVRLQAVVTYYDPAWSIFFVQDATGGIYVDSHGLKAFDIKPGQLVQIEGQSHPGDFAPNVVNPRLRVLGAGAMPTPPETSVEDLFTGQFDSRWVEAEGVVQSIREDDRHAFINLASGIRRFRVQMPLAPQQALPTHLVDARVRVRGVCGTRFNRRRQLTGIQIFVSDLRQISVERTGAPDPFTLPVRPISSLLQYTPDERAGHRVRVQGIVTLQRPGGVYIKDSTGGLFVQTQDPTPAQPGDQVDVVGFPATGGYTPILQDASWRNVSAGPPPEPIVVTAEEALQGTYDSQLVRLEAYVLDRVLSSAEQVMTLQAGKIVFNAHLDPSPASGAVADLRNGSLVQLTGICSVQADMALSDAPRSFRLFLRSPEDVVVVERAPWWTLRHTLWAAGTLLLSTLAVTGWVVMLRRRVRIQTGIIRQRLEREAALEQRYRHLVESANDMIYTCDLAGRFASINKAGEQILGYRRDEILKMNVADLAVPERREAVRQYIASTEPVGDVKTHQVEMVASDGRRVALEVSTQFIYEDGQPVAVLGIGRDVTERKRAEAELWRERELMKALMEYTPDSVYFKDADSRFLRVSRALARRVGLDEPEQVVGKSDFDFFDAEHAEPARADEVKIMDTGEPLIGIEERELGPDGRQTWVSTTKVPLRDQQGQIIGTFGISRDITERKRVEEALRQSEERYRTIIEEMADSYWEFDLKGHFTFFNNQVMVEQGRSREELLALNNSTNRQHVDEENWKRASEILRQVYLTGEPVRGATFELIRGDGTRYVTESSISLIRDAEGKPVGFRGISRDVTKRTQAERELRQAKEAAEAATRAKSEFLANMSHEIRTPMNAIIGMTGLLLDTDLTPEQKEFAETIRGSGDTLLTIINDILDFSKIESGKLELESQPFDLRQCVEESLDLLAPKAAEKGLELVYLIDDHTPQTLVGDVTRLRQVLVNLLSNAVKFTSAGEIMVSVDGGWRMADGGLKETPTSSDFHLSTEEREAKTNSLNPPSTIRHPPSCELHFSVRDTGIGIPPDRMDRLFQSFSQVDASTTRQYGGTGLGLAISKRLVEMMGGRIWVESEVGQGSTFHFTIVSEAAPSQPHVYVPGRESSLSGKRLLIVDDSATSRRILTLQAKSWGMQPRAAGSGAEALAWIERGDPFDVAILDMHMPEMDGLTLAAEIQTHRDARTLPLVMLTSMGRPREIPNSKHQIPNRLGFGNGDLGFPPKEVGPPVLAAFLTKPVKSSQLHDVLAGVLQPRPVEVEPPTPVAAFDRQLAERLPLRILLAEDNAVNQKVALRILERLGYRADMAANGLEVLQALRRQPYDVVLMDVQMPELDGLAATRLICRQWPSAQRPRLIAMTANAMQGDREECLAAGMDDYISKPVRPGELQQALERCRPLAADDGHPANGTDEMQARLRDLRQDLGADFVMELVETFLDDSRELLTRLRQANGAGRADELARTAHTLTGSSANLGAQRMAQLSAELERVGQSGSTAEAEILLSQLEQEFERVRWIFSHECHE